MFTDFNSISNALPSLSSEGSSGEGSRATTARLSTGTVKYNPIATSPNWHLPEDWNWTGDNTNPKDVFYTKGSEFTGKEWSRSSDSAVLGNTFFATVTRVICSGKVLARKTVKKNARFPKLHLQEADILRKLKHQHIVQLCGTYDLPTTHSILLFPVAEIDLKEFLHIYEKEIGDRPSRPTSQLEPQKRLETPNWTRTLTSGLGCLSNALAYIHANGIKHRDIKPQNILILGDVMILSDFGGAVDFRDRDTGSKSEELDGMTRLYAPPEALKMEEHGRSGDVFSLGLVMSEMIEYLWNPWGPSSVELRLMERDDGKRKTPFLIPKPMTSDEEEFLHWFSSAGKVVSEDDACISVEDMNFLFQVMTAKDPDKRPRAHDVWAYLRGRHYDTMVGDGGWPPTCGRCCM